MNADYWRQVEELYTQVAELEAESRSRVLNDRRTHHPQVVAEVESLLAAEPPSEEFLSTPWVAGGPAAVGAVPPLAGSTVGPFRLLHAIGSGGMGTVYLAEREDGGFVHQVAVKIVPAARWHPASLKQFKAERQLLAALHHPHIVTLIDSGITTDGLAYLAMEYVDGVPITRYCSERTLSMRARLALFQQVCGAVQYAHRHAIVHRDLKPANLLITPDGVPKILDFGVARLVADRSSTLQQTTVGLMGALTPNYASPEQIRAMPPSTADDVYALGVVLFELLTGRVPFDTVGRALDEVLRMVVEDAAPRPSSLATLPEVRAPQLRGDLDAIVLKALDKDPTRRYGSVQELSDDVGRHLAGQPVVAREPSFVYMLATLSRRHRALVLASTISVVAVLLALGVSLVQTRRAIAERDRADQRFGDVRRLANTLIFDIHDAVTPLAGSTPVRRRIVAEALEYLEVLARDGGDDALLIELAQAYQRVATVQGNPSGPNLGDREGAVASYEKAVALLEPVAERSREAAVALVRVRLAMLPVLNALGRTDAVLSTVSTATEAAERFAVEAPSDSASTLLGSAYFWRATFAPQGPAPGESISWWLKAREVYEGLLSAQPESQERQRNVALVAKYLGEQYRVTGQLELAFAQHQRAQSLDERRVAAAPGDRRAQLDLALDWASLGGLSREMGRHADAVQYYERSLAVRQQLADTDPTDDYTQGRLAYAHMMLGLAYNDVGRDNDAFAHLRTSVRLNESLPSSDTGAKLNRSQSLVSLARVEQQRGRREDACAHYQAARLHFTADGDAVSGVENSRREIEDGVTTGLAWCGATPR